MSIPWLLFFEYGFLIAWFTPSANRVQRLLVSASSISSGHDYTQIMSAEETLAIEKKRCT